MPERATTTTLAYTSRSAGGATDAEGNLPKTRDRLESMMRGYNSPRTGSGRCGGLGEVLARRPRRLPGRTPRRRADRAEAGGGQLLPVDE
jgi:hypothetical protein